MANTNFDNCRKTSTHPMSVHEMNPKGENTTNNSRNNYIGIWKDDCNHRAKNKPRAKAKYSAFALDDFQIEQAK